MKTQSLSHLTALLLICHPAAAQTNAAIPWDQLGAKAGADYKGDGLTVSATRDGARLRCVFQRLDGEATSEGLWLASTVPGQANDRFRVKATTVGRATNIRSADLQSAYDDRQSKTAPSAQLPNRGKVSVDGQTVRFTRPGLVEEYSVTMDGLRQDFVVLDKPTRNTQPLVAPKRSEDGSTHLRLELAITGATVESQPNGAQLVLRQSNRRIAYSRLQVTDANGKELPGRIEVSSNPAPSTLQSALAMAVVVDDSDAVYPVRIDPTFSDANWTSMNPSIPGADNRVFAAVVDGLGNLYIGGSFTLVGDVIANRIAKWNGTSWSSLGSGMNRDVYVLAVSGGDVYAGGYFTMAGGIEANYIARWNGTSWKSLGAGMDSSVWVLAVSDNDLYAGGFFTIATNTGGVAVAVKGIAKWNGSSWSALGAGLNSSVTALAVSGNDLYVGGYFTMATNTGGATVTVNGIAKWNGTYWSALGSGMNSAVTALAVSGSDVYAGGYFTTADGSDAKYVAKWSGTAWSALGGGMNNSVATLVVFGSDVYAGGVFTTAGASDAKYIAKWNGNVWSGLGSGMGGAPPDYHPGVYTLAVAGSYLFVGGMFTTAGGSAADYIARWNGNAWSALGAGINNRVATLAVSGSDVYAGGAFISAGTGVANYIAKWNGSAWIPLGAGMNGSVETLVVSATNVYAGGYFTTAGGSGAAGIAKWDGNVWSPLGSGMNGAVYALAVSGTNVYAGGAFTNAGGGEANYIARWDGSSWSALGAGMNGRVYALAVLDSDLYVGGEFTTAGGRNASYIAKWNGSAWSDLGSGMSWTVCALAVSGSNVYAGGLFYSAGGGAASSVAKWNGDSWSALGSGIQWNVNAGGVSPMGGGNASVLALLVSGGELYAGGEFRGAGGLPANFIAKWDGSTWSALGSGMGGGFNISTVYALAVSGSELYVGGNFSTAGGKVSAYLAKAIAIPGDWLRVARDVPGPHSNTLSFVGVPDETYTIQFTTNLDTPDWLPLATTNADSNGRAIVLDPDASAPKRFYRVTSP